jgi:hypothetical protein
MSLAAREQPAAGHALRFAAASLGFQCELVNPQEAADVHYGEERRAGTAFVPYWAECYAPAEPHVGVPAASERWWVPARRAGERPVDLIGGIARLLNLLDEAQVAEGERGADGVFMISALPKAREATHAVPLVDWHVAELGRLLQAAGVDLSGGEARWPEGARYAVVLTHDTDAAGLHDLRELLRVSLRAVRYRSPSMLAAALSAATGWLRGVPDPQFQFAGWASLEQTLGVRSAFYVHARDGRRQHLHDPTYAVDDDPRWNVLGDLIEEGWEVGVHAAIQSGSTTGQLARERMLLEAVVHHPVRGLRHHYWRLDWRAPWRTFRKHEEAGYTYDTSIAWRDRYGFRAGTSQPYQPFDRERRRTLDIVELPTTVMDGHLFEYLGLTPAEAVAALRGLSTTVRGAGGLLNLNWHQETYGNRHAHRGWRDTYETIVSELAQDPDAWIATPHEVAHWWLERLGRLGGTAMAGDELPADPPGGQR